MVYPKGPRPILKPSCWILIHAFTFWVQWEERNCVAQLLSSERKYYPSKKQHKTVNVVSLNLLPEAQVLIYTLQSKFLKYYIGPAQWSAQMHHHRIPSVCAQSKDFLKSTHTQYLEEKRMLKIKSCSVATSAKTQDAGKQGIKGYGSFVKKGSGIWPVVWARTDNRADARSSSGNSWYRWEVSPTPLFLQQFAFYFP